MPYTHGGDIYGDAAVELDFSVNTNRLGMPEAVRDAVIASTAAWEQYPDALCRKLRRSAAAFYEAFVHIRVSLIEQCLNCIFTVVCG